MSSPVQDKQEYGLGVTPKMSNMAILKRSDMWITDSGAPNHVTFSDLGCVNKRRSSGATHGIVDKSVQQPKWEAYKPCTHYNKDGKLIGNLIMTDVSHLSECSFNLFSTTRLQKRGWKLKGTATYIKLNKGDSTLMFDQVFNTPKGGLFVDQFPRQKREGSKCRGSGRQSAYLQYNLSTCPSRPQ